MMHSEPDVAQVVTDRRRPPFCFQTLDALAVIRDEFTGAKRATALGVYLTFTEVANTVGGAAARGDFRATRKDVATLSGVSLDTLDRYVKDFERIGLVEVIREKTAAVVNLPNRWAILDVSAPPGRTGAATPAALVRPLARDPFQEEVDPEEEHTAAIAVVEANRPRTVAGKAVKDSEYAAASEVLAMFNTAAQTNFVSVDWVKKIIGRVREHPNLSRGDHGEIITRTLAAPWWSGSPSPSVIYGNAAIFERSMMSLRHPGADAAVTAEEMSGYGTVWGPGTPYATPAAATEAGRSTVDDAEWTEVPDGEA